MDKAGPTSHSFISQRLRLHYVDWGNPEAPPLILQHGGRDHCRSWDWAAQELRKDWHVIAPDLRGHGDSAWSPDGNYTMGACVYDFAQLVRHLNYEKVSIVAHSLGGAITTEFTGLFPEKVERFVNIEGLGFGRDVMGADSEVRYADRMRRWIADRHSAAGRQPRRYPTLREAYERMKEANSYLTDEQARHLTIHGTNRNEDGTFSWKYDNYTFSTPPNYAARQDAQRLWSAITCPVLLLWGQNSFFSNPGQDGRLEYFRNARLEVYKNAGHWLHHDQFDRFMADITEFLAP